MQKAIKQNLTDKNLKIILSKVPRKKLSRFLNSKIHQLCQDHILPNEKLYKRKTKKVMHTFFLQEAEIGDSGKTNIELLTLFSKYHKISNAKVVYLYILLLLQEEEYLKKKIKSH